MHSGLLRVLTPDCTVPYRWNVTKNLNVSLRHKTFMKLNPFYTTLALIMTLEQLQIALNGPWWVCNPLGHFSAGPCTASLRCHYCDSNHIDNCKKSEPQTLGCMSSSVVWCSSGCFGFPDSWFLNHLLVHSCWCYGTCTNQIYEDS